MNHTEFNQKIKAISTGDRIDLEKVAALSNAEKDALVHHLVRNRAAIVREFISPTLDTSWLYAMGYCYETRGVRHTFVHNSETFITKPLNFCASFPGIQINKGDCVYKIVEGTGKVIAFTKNMPSGLPVQAGAFVHKNRIEFEIPRRLWTDLEVEQLVSVTKTFFPDATEVGYTWF